MCFVNQTNWTFPGENGSKGGLFFKTSLELISYLANDEHANYPQIQNVIEKRTNEDPVALSWYKKRTYLKDLKHFRNYRKDRYDLYHAAARGAHAGVASAKQLVLYNGLEAEIDNSQITVPAGQILFHGRADRDVTKLVPYPSFISTSLDPVVACNSAFRRAGANKKGVVYILKIAFPLKALWGNMGQSSEYEILLPIVSP